MRHAEQIMALALVAFSLFLMWKSSELPIGWVSGKGPGGGAFPFWLSLGMLVASGVIFWRARRRVTPQSRDENSFMGYSTFRLFVVSAGAIFVMFLGTHFVGAYVMIPLFLAFYMRFLGGHSWVVIAPIALLAPIVTFFFFEIGMKVFLPKGVTEPLFYPLYSMFF